MTGLARRLGTGDAVVIGLGSMIGAGVFSAFSPAAAAAGTALLIGLAYVFIWEATLAAYLDGIRFLSIRRFTLALVHGLDQGRLATLDTSLGTGPAVAGTAIVLVGFATLAVWKLSRMDVP